jgi:hypothetical protein
MDFTVSPDIDAPVCFDQELENSSLIDPFGDDRCTFDPSSKFSGLRKVLLGVLEVGRLSVLQQELRKLLEVHHFSCLGLELCQVVSELVGVDAVEHHD